MIASFYEAPGRFVGCESLLMINVVEQGVCHQACSVSRMEHLLYAPARPAAETSMMLAVRCALHENRGAEFYLLDRLAYLLRRLR